MEKVKSYSKRKFSVDSSLLSPIRVQEFKNTNKKWLKAQKYSTDLCTMKSLTSNQKENGSFSAEKSFLLLKILKRFQKYMSQYKEIEHEKKKDFMTAQNELLVKIQDKMSKNYNLRQTFLQKGYSLKSTNTNNAAQVVKKRSKVSCLMVLDKLDIDNLEKDQKLRHQNKQLLQKIKRGEQYLAKFRRNTSNFDWSSYLKQLSERVSQKKKYLQDQKIKYLNLQHMQETPRSNTNLSESSFSGSISENSSNKIETEINLEQLCQRLKRNK